MDPANHQLHDVSPASTMLELIKRAGLSSYFANDSVAAAFSEDPAVRHQQMLEVQSDVEKACKQLLVALGIDSANDHNTQETAKRMAKMYMTEVMKGRYDDMPDITSFPNAKKLDEMYTVGPIRVRSMCSHHFVPIMGYCWIGVIPSDRVIGLSKFNRLVDWIMARPQIQEESTVQLADLIEGLIKPKALGVVVKAQHMCMSWRGVRDSSWMTTSVMRGFFHDRPHAKAEFMEIIKASGFNSQD